MSARSWNEPKESKEFLELNECSVSWECLDVKELRMLSSLSRSVEISPRESGLLSWIAINLERGEGCVVWLCCLLLLDFRVKVSLLGGIRILVCKG